MDIIKELKKSRDLTFRDFNAKLIPNIPDEKFDTEYPEKIAKIKTDEYYINMMLSWYFATILTKQYDKVLPFFQNQKLTKWVHNKSIQKAIESRRISSDHKEVLRQLKQK